MATKQVKATLHGYVLDIEVTDPSCLPLLLRTAADQLEGEEWEQVYCNNGRLRHNGELVGSWDYERRNVLIREAIPEPPNDR